MSNYIPALPYHPCRIVNNGLVNTSTHTTSFVKDMLKLDSVKTKHVYNFWDAVYLDLFVTTPARVYIIQSSIQSQFKRYIVKPLMLFNLFHDQLRCKWPFRVFLADEYSWRGVL